MTIPADIRSQLANLERCMGRVESAVKELKDAIVKQDTDGENLERRMRRVENRQHLYSGAAGILGVIAGWFGRMHT